MISDHSPFHIRVVLLLASLFLISPCWADSTETISNQSEPETSTGTNDQPLNSNQPTPSDQYDELGFFEGIIARLGGIKQQAPASSNTTRRKIRFFEGWSPRKINTRSLHSISFGHHIGEFRYQNADHDYLYDFYGWQAKYGYQYSTHFNATAQLSIGTVHEAVQRNQNSGFKIRTQLTGSNSIEEGKFNQLIFINRITTPQKNRLAGHLGLGVGVNDFIYKSEYKSRHERDLISAFSIGGGFNAGIVQFKINYIATQPLFGTSRFTKSKTIELNGTFVFP